jgi:hypothetical protein
MLALAMALGLHAAAAAHLDLDCTYQTPAGGTPTISRCAWRDARGQLRVAPRYLRRLTYDRFGLASLYADGWRYVTRDGRTAAVMGLDNWADPFADGLARSPADGKVGYIDRRLALAIPARFDGAYPFEHGIAVVCVGCRAVAEDENASYAGGQWGCIDRRARYVVPLHPAAGYEPCPSSARPKG